MNTFKGILVYNTLHMRSQTKATTINNKAVKLRPERLQEEEEQEEEKRQLGDEIVKEMQRGKTKERSGSKDWLQGLAQSVRGACIEAAVAVIVRM